MLKLSGDNAPLLGMISESRDAVRQCPSGKNHLITILINDRYIRLDFSSQEQRHGFLNQAVSSVDRYPFSVIRSS